MGFFESLINRGSSRSKALALYKRGMSKAKKHDQDGAVEDYSAAIDMPDAPPDVTAMAMYNRAIAYAAAKDIDSSVVDLKAGLAMPELPTNIKAAAHEKLKRVNRRSNESDSAQA
jgi:hypothetical protein